MRDRKIFQKLAWLAAALGIIAAPAALLSWTESDDVDPHNHSLNALTSTLRITKGGTGAITAEAARESLGVVLGAGGDVQPYDADLDLLSQFSTFSTADGVFIVGDGDSLLTESGATARASMGVTIGSQVQAYDADLDVLSAFTSISSADGAVPIGDGAGMTSETGATFRTSVGVAIGSDVQAYDSDLDVFAAFSSISTADGKFIVGDGSAFVVEDGATARTSLGLTIGTDVQAYDSDLDALAVFSSLSTADGEVVIGDGSGFTSESGSTARTSLGLAIGTNVQAYDSDLGVLSAFTSISTADGKFIVGSGTDFVSESGATARTSLGLGAAALLGTPLTVSSGGTSSTTASAARTALGVAIGSDVQAWDDDLDDVAALTPTDSYVMVGDGSDWVTESGATARTSLGVAIGTDVQAYDSDLSVLATFTSISTADGKVVIGDGSGFVSESGSTVRTSLGLVIGSNVQAWDDDLDDVAALTPTDSYVMVGDGSDWVTESGATARTSLGVAIGSDVQAYDADLSVLATFTSISTADSEFIVGDGSGFVSENGATVRTSMGLGSIATQAANNVAITGGSVAGITDLAVADGGTGSGTAANARTALGVAIGSDVQAWDDDLDDVAALTPTDSNIMVGDGSDWVAESGSTARTSLGLAIGTNVQAWDDDLDDLAGLAVTDGNFAVGDGSDWTAESGAAARTSMGVAIGSDVQAYDADLAALAVFSSLSSADGKVVIGDGEGFTSESGATIRTSLGLVIDTDVQAYDAELDTIAGLSPSEGHFLKWVSGVWTTDTSPGDLEADAHETITGDWTFSGVSSFTGGTTVSTLTATGNVSVDGGTLVFNDTQADLDARFESDANANALQIDGGLHTGTGAIGMLAAASVNAGVLVSPPAKTLGAASNYFHQYITRSGATTVPTGTTTYVGTLNLDEPNITATGTVTNAFTVRIGGAPTEGSALNAALWIDSGDAIFDGNVGIGTASPGYKLEVEGSGDVDANVKSTGADGNYAALRLSGSENWMIGTNNSTWGGAQSSLFINDTGEVNVVISNSGNFGIGTASPAGRLDVEGGEINLDADDDTGITADTDDQIDIELGGTDLVVLSLGDTQAAWLELKSTNTGTTPGIEVSSPASHAAEMRLAFKQGDGTGSANNMQYFFSHDTNNAYFKLRSTDTDGSATNADIFRVPDGQLTVDGNSTFDDSAFDYVCKTCGHHQSEPGMCPLGHGELVWQDDVELMRRAIRDLRNDPETLKWLEKLGIVNTYGTAGSAQPELFISMNRAPWFNMSGIVQLQDKLDQFKYLSAKGKERFQVQLDSLRGDIKALAVHYETAYEALPVKDEPAPAAGKDTIIWILCFSQVFTLGLVIYFGRRRG